MLPTRMVRLLGRSFLERPSLLRQILSSALLHSSRVGGAQGIASLATASSYNRSRSATVIQRRSRSPHLGLGIAEMSSRAASKRAKREESAAPIFSDDEAAATMPVPSSGGLLSGMPALAPVAGLNLKRLFKGTLKVHVSVARPHFAIPWSMKNAHSSTASGFVIKHNGRYVIITNAHAVANATQVQVRFHGSAVKLPAKVLAVAHDCDLAILDCDGLQEEGPARVLELSDRVPELQETVNVVGYPLGGDQLSISTGVCSRIDFGLYTHASRDNLCVQVDAAINSGNSGGPVFSADGKVVGVAFQSMDAQDAQLVGYVIPIPVLRHVLADYDKTGKAVPFGRLGFYYQTAENKHFEKACKVPKGKSGVMITRLVPVSDAAKQLKVGDIVMGIDGHAIAGDGTISFREDERVLFGYLLTTKTLGETVSLEVLREGATMTITLPLEDFGDLVPKSLYEQRPSYVVFGGLVFTPLSEPFLQASYGSREWESKAPVKYVSLAYNGMVEQPGQQVIVLSQILQNNVVAGFEFEDFLGSPLSSINGVSVNDIADVAAMLRVEGLMPPPPPPAPAAAKAKAVAGAGSAAAAGDATEEAGEDKGAPAVGRKRKRGVAASSAPDAEPSASSSSSSSSSPSSSSAFFSNANAPSSLVATGIKRHLSDPTLRAKIEAVAAAPLMRFEFSDGRVIILPRAEALEATKEVMAVHAIPSPLSHDLAAALSELATKASASAGAAAVDAAGVLATADVAASGSSGSAVKKEKGDAVAASSGGGAKKHAGGR